MLKVFNHLAYINEGIFLDQVPVIIRVRVRVVLAGGEGDGGELRGGTGLKLTKIICDHGSWTVFLTFLKVFCCLILFLMDCGAGEPIRRCRSGI